MIIDYKWVRHVTPPTSYLSGITTNVSNNFAVYMGDHSFGTRVRWQVESTDSAGAYYWRFRTVTAYAKIYDIEIEYTFTRSGGGSINSETLKARTWNTAGTAPQSSFVSIPVTGNGPGDVTFDALFSPGSASTVPAETAETIFPGTTAAQYEHRDASYSLLAGGIGASGGVLGVGGFDIRMLAIKSLRAEKVSTNLLSDENLVNFKADIYALPGDTSLFSAWQPSSDIDVVIQVGDLSATELYYEFQGSVTPLTPSTAGLVANVSIPTSSRWPGTDASGNIVDGLSLVIAQALADNPDGIPTTSVTKVKDARALTYQCSSCSNGGLSMSVPLESTRSPNGAALDPAMSYIGFDFGQLPASTGYGWSSEASSKVIDSGTELVFKSGSGGYMRWIKVGGDYVPFSPGNYTEATVDPGSSTARYKLTFKDQSVYEFDTAGKLRRKVDRNGNALSYAYNSTTGYLEVISDGNGRAHYYTNRSDGQPLELRVNNATTGRLTQFVYYSSSHPDSPDRLHKVIDPEGNETEFVYYANGPLWYVVDPQGNTASVIGYDEFGRRSAEIVYGELLRTYFYGTSGASLEVLEEDLVGSEPDRSRYMEFDKLGNTVRVLELVDTVGPVINETLMEYADSGNPYLLTTRTDPNLTQTVMTYTTNGNIKTVTDKAGNVTTYTYAEEIDSPLNPKHRNLVREIQRPDVTVEGVLVTYDPTVLEYDANGNLERVTDAKGEVTEITRDTDGLVLTVTNRRGHTTEMVYQGDPFNEDSRNLLQVKTPKGDGPGDGFRVIEFEYGDGYDNVTLVRDDLGNEVATVYDLLDRPFQVMDALGQSIIWTYANMLLEGVVMPSNNGSGGLDRLTTMLYDNTNRLQEVRRDVDSLGTQEMRVKYGYTGFSQMAELTRLKNGFERSFAFSFDRLGRQVLSVDSLPTPGVSAMAYEPFCTGNASTSARGIRRKTSFDSRCLLTQVAMGEVDPSDPLEVLNARELREWSHDELGRMVKSSQTRSSRYSQAVMGIDLYGGKAEEKLYLFDELDRLVEMRFRSNEDPMGANDKLMAWEYDPEGNVTKMTDPEGKVTRYIYLRDNLLKEVIVERSGDPDRVFTYSHDLAGRLLQIVYPSGTGVVAKFDDGTNTPGSGWDAKGQLLHLRYEKDGDLIRRFELTYDDSGNRASLLDVTDGTVLTARAVKWEFIHDWLDRLITVNRSEASTVAGLPSIIAPFSSFTFDESDNRVTYKDEVADKLYRYVVDDADNLTEIYLTEGSDPEILLETVESDPDGNMLTRTNEITDEVIAYQWDDADRLTQVSSAIGGVKTSTMKEHNRYNVDGIRKRKLGKNGNSAEYTAGISTASSKALTSSSTAPTVSYVQGHQILGCEVDGEFQWWLGDHLGSIREVVDDTGAVIRSMEFDVHGQLLNSSGTGTFAPKTYQGALSVNDDTADSGLYLMGHRHFESGLLGRFISRDPIGFKGGLHLFNGAGASPITFMDPYGTQPTQLERIVNEIRTRKYSKECKKAVDLLRNSFCPKGSDSEVRLDVPTENVLDAILDPKFNVEFRAGDPTAQLSGETTNFAKGPLDPENHSLMTLKGNLGSVSAPIPEAVLEVAFHEFLHLTGVGHYNGRGWTQPFLAGEAFMIHVARLCLGTSGKHTWRGYQGAQIYDSGDYDAAPGLRDAINACPLP